MSYGDERPIAATKPVRRTRMQNANQFKLGLFGMNCSGSVATTAPERWNAGWPENRAAARMAEAAGIEFLLPIARWLGYGGLTDRQGTSFETLSWASAVLAATTDIVAFATVHVPLVNPVFAAKSCVTADHVGRGRFGLNVVSGWNLDELLCSGRSFSSMTTGTDTARSGFRSSSRYGRKQSHSTTAASISTSGTLAASRSLGRDASFADECGSSPAGRSFASRHADCLFMVISDEEMVADEIAALRAAKQELGIFASGHLMCRPTAKETKEYYHYLVHEKGDWEGAETVIRKRLAGDGRSLPQDRLRAMMERFISGGGTFPVIGSYDEVAATMKRLSDAGLDGMALASVNYVQEMPVIRDELLPRLARLGLREPLH